MTTTTSSVRYPPAHHRVRIRALTVVAAVALAVVVWGVASLLGVDLEVGTGTASSAKQVGIGAVVATALMVSLLAWALLALLEWRTAHARTIWTTAAATVLLLSFAGPVIEGGTTPTKIVLSALHIMVGSTVIVGLRRRDLTR